MPSCAPLLEPERLSIAGLDPVGGSGGEPAMADASDVEFARGVIRDSLVLLRWAASADGIDDEQNPLVPDTLKPAMAAAVEEVHDGAFTRALRILDGEDPAFSQDDVRAALDSVGWSGASRAFKEQALNEGGREEVMGAVERGGPKPRGKVWKKFLKLLNIALGSLSIVPGVEQIKELKDFAETASEE
jgi:hypothetical protein